MLTVNDVLVRKLILNTYKTLLTRGFVLCRPEKKVYKKRNFIWGQNAAGRCVSVSDVRGDAARCGGTRPRSVFRGVDCQ